jgi:ribosomal protein S7
MQSARVGTDGDQAYVWEDVAVIKVPTRQRRRSVLRQALDDIHPFEESRVFRVLDAESASELTVTAQLQTEFSID